MKLDVIWELLAWSSAALVFFEISGNSKKNTFADLVEPLTLLNFTDWCNFIQESRQTWPKAVTSAPVIEQGFVLLIRSPHSDDIHIRLDNLAFSLKVPF